MGDHLLYGPGLGRDVINQIGSTGATILEPHVSNPKDSGVIEFDSNGVLIKIIEKLTNSSSSCAFAGAYFYGESASERVRELKPSERVSEKFQT